MIETMMTLVTGILAWAGRVEYKLASFGRDILNNQVECQRSHDTLKELIVVQLDGIRDTVDRIERNTDRRLDRIEQMITHE